MCHTAGSPEVEPAAITALETGLDCDDQLSESWRSEWLSDGEI